MGHAKADVLPSKLRLQGSLETEARQRTPTLQAYISRLAQNETLLRSEPLFYFLAAHRAPPRQHLWEQLTAGSVPEPYLVHVHVHVHVQ